MATQHGDPELQSSIRDIDYTQGQIALLLAAQSNDRERYALAEKIIPDLVNKNERLLKERQGLLESTKDLFERNDILFAMSAQQLDKIQILEKQLETVKEHPGSNNIKKTPVFMHIPDTKANNWKTPTVSYQNKQVALHIMCEILGLPPQNIQGVDDVCPYCEKPHHTREQCRARKFDGNMKDKVNMLVPSLKRIYKSQEEILQQGIRKGLRPYQEKMMRSILNTLKGMKIGGNTIKELMDTEEYHQGENNECNVNAYLQNKGRPTRLKSTQDQEYDEEDDPYCQGLEESTYDSDQECQEHDDLHGNQDIPQEDEDDHGYQDHDDDQQESETYNDTDAQDSDQEEGETDYQDDQSDEYHNPTKAERHSHTSWIVMEDVEDHEGRQSPQD